jgi:hypothetical protein
MICPKCGFDQPDGSIECLKCGIIFDRYRDRRKGRLDADLMRGAKVPLEEADGKKEIVESIKAILLHVKPEINVFYFVGRVLLFAVIVFWGIKFIVNPMESNYSGRSFMHLVNLPFHEAGHIIFRLFGRFMMTLGGSIMQLLVPVICLTVFLSKSRDTFAASVTLWWLGESFMDLAPYINDARALKLVLLGGVTGRDVQDYHDWEYILRKLGMLECDHILALAAHITGILLILCALTWGGYLLFGQFRNLDSMRQ